MSTNLIEPAVANAGAALAPLRLATMNPPLPRGRVESF